ncbi:MAG: curved DNA-binding protein [Halioglobus sp.]|jgi:curved DNA-binding protein
MEFKDYYKILGLEESADKKAVKTAYRKLARKYHPDVSDHHDAENKFKEASEAYEVLKDADKRAEYDELRQYRSGNGNFAPPPDWQDSRASSGARDEHDQGDFSDFFSSIFGESAKAQSRGYSTGGGFGRRGQDIETDMPVFLEDTLAEGSKTISYHLPHYDNNGRVTQVKKTLNVKIPAGATDGERIRLKGQGAAGVGDSSSGDLYLRVKLVPHPLFDVEGHNLTVTVPVAPWETALGAKITVPTLDGKVQMSIPAGSQSGQKFRIKGKGLISRTGTGDLYAVLNVVMPDSMNDGVKAQWEELAKTAAFDPRAQWGKVS